MYFILLYFVLLGVCTIPVCSARTPLEGSLCRIGVDDECFVVTMAGTGDQVCVPECPQGTEEEHDPDSGVSTGLLIEIS
jgi:hypothetical protein